MKKAGILIIPAALLTLSQAGDARLYRWIDEQGNVYYSDKKPPTDAKGLTELDQRGIVRKAPDNSISASEAARQEAERKAVLEQRRRDKALLDSFSNTDEIEELRQRQAAAVEARLQTVHLLGNQNREKLARLNAEAERYARKNRKVPASLSGDIDSTRKQLETLDAESRRLTEEMAAINERADQAKKRFLELRSAH